MPALLISTSSPPSAVDRRRHHGSISARLAHVAAARDEAGDLLGERRERPVVDVADENLGAVRGEGAREFAADAGGAGGDQHALRHRFPHLQFFALAHVRLSFTMKWAANCARHPCACIAKGP